MAENSKISQIKLPNGSTYDIEDNTSGYITGITSSDVTGALGFTPYNSTNPNGYTNNIGTITSVKTTAGAHTTINVSSGAAEFNVPTKTSDLINDSGFITNDSDEKVKYVPIQGTDTNTYGLLYAQNNGGSEQTSSVYTGRMRFQPSTGTLSIFNSTGSRVGTLTPFQLSLKHNASTYSGNLVIANLTASRTYTLPNASGTIALISDIPVETDPIFIASAAYGITSTDITNWNNKLDSYTETDPTVPAWAKASTKPTYSLSEISNTDDLQTIEALSDGPGLLRRYYNGATQSYYWGLDTTHYLTKSDINFTDGTNGFTLTLYDSTQYWVTITPSVAFSELTSTPTTLSGYGITNAYTKTEIDGLVAGVLHYKGTKASVANLPTTGNTTGDVWHITADGSEYAWDGTIWQELGTAVDLSSYVTTDDSRLSDARTPLVHNQALSTITGAEDLQAIEALSGTSGFLKKTAVNTWTLDTNTYLTSYTETDPVFSASAAAGITSTDISNWNAKVSDDKTWNNKSLSMSTTTGNNFYVPRFNSTSADTAYLTLFTATPTASCGVRYDGSAYIYSTTPTANDNSTKVATTAYVDNAIPKVYSSTNTGGYLTMATLPIYDGTVV